MRVYEFEAVLRRDATGAETEVKNFKVTEAPTGILLRAIESVREGRYYGDGQDGENAEEIAEQARIVLLARERGWPI